MTKVVVTNVPAVALPSELTPLPGAKYAKKYKYWG